jgi:methionyl-tRNA synthetase
MAEADRYYVTTPIYYCERCAAYRARVYHARLRCPGAVHAAGRAEGAFPDRYPTSTGRRWRNPLRRPAWTPQAFTDKVSQNFRDLAKAMNYSNDDFIRTTEERHKKSCQEIWRRLKDRGEIYLGPMPAGMRCAMRPITVRKN